MSKPEGLLGTRSECKVGWEYYKTRKDAVKQQKRILEHAAMKEAKGYDFGYCSPGYITELKKHPQYAHCF